jgi:AraC-like DNA-binding protein
MLSLTYIPRPPLSEFIHFLWLYDGYSQPHAKERILPSGEMQLVINLAEDQSRFYDRDDFARCHSFRGALLYGSHSGYQVIDTAEQASVIGVHFRPGGAFPFLRMPAGELSETTLALESLWGRAAVDLRDRLLGAPTHQARFLVLEEALLAEFLRGARVAPHAAVTFALRGFFRAPQTGTIASVTDRIGLSPKRFIQAFRDQTGFTPKVFCRIRRFQKALDRIESCRGVDWSTVALDAGYFDQAHFNHDFRAFSGINPSTYLARRTPHRNHVPLPE